MPPAVPSPSPLTGGAGPPPPQAASRAPSAPYRPAAGSVRRSLKRRPGLRRPRPARGLPTGPGLKPPQAPAKVPVGPPEVRRESRPAAPSASARLLAVPVFRIYEDRTRRTPTTFSEIFKELSQGFAPTCGTRKRAGWAAVPTRRGAVVATGPPRPAGRGPGPSSATRWPAASPRSAPRSAPGRSAGPKPAARASRRSRRAPPTAPGRSR